MKKSSVIIIAGPPASGKTVLANTISERLGLTLISKDDIKVQIYQALSDNDLPDDEVVAKVSYKILFYLFESFVKIGVDFIVESNFDLKNSVNKIMQIKEIYDFDSQTILCNADMDVLYKRFVNRDNSKERSPCLVCKQYHDFEAFCKRQNELNCHLFDVGGEKIIYDTTEFDNNSIEKVINEVNKFLKK